MPLASPPMRDLVAPMHVSPRLTKHRPRASQTRRPNFLLSCKLRLTVPVINLKCRSSNRKYFHRVWTSSLNPESHTPIVTPEDFFAPTRLQTRSTPVARNCIAACGSDAEASQAISRVHRRSAGDRIQDRSFRQHRRVQSASRGDDGDGVDLDEIVGRGHLADLDHGGGWRRRAKIFAPHFVDLLEMLHVADVDVDAADVVHAAAGLLDRGLQILADLARLRFDVADAGDRAIGPPRGHAGNEDDAAARLDHGRVGKMAGRLADFRRCDLLLGHALAPDVRDPASERRASCGASRCARASISMRMFRVYCRSPRRKFAIKSQPISENIAIGSRFDM